jgi:hypothetical protein
MAQGEHARFTFGPLDRSGVILGLRLAQLSVLVAGWALALAVLLVSHGTILGGAGVVVLAAGTLWATFGHVYGRGVDEWIPVVVRWLLAPRAWRASTPQRGHLLAGGTLVDEQPILPPMLAGIRILSAPVQGGGRLGVVRDASAGTYTGVIRVRGSSYTLLSDPEKAAHLAVWGGALASMAHHGSPVDAVQVVVRTVVEDPDGIARHLDAHRQLPPDSAIFRSYLRLVEGAAPVTQAQEVLVGLAVSRRRGARTIAAAGGGDSGATVVLTRLLAQLMAHLERAHVEVEGALTPRLIAQALREAWDPQSSHPLRRRSAADAHREGVAVTNCGPQSLRTSWRYLMTDSGAVHATYWISEWPRVDVGPNVLVPLLLQTSARLTFSVTMRPVEPGRAQRDLEAAQTAHLSDETLRERHGFRTPVRTHRQADAVERREREFADGHAEYRFSGYLTVTADSTDELEAACADVEQQARTCRLDVRRLDGEHDLAFTFTLPLCRGVR